MSSNRRTILIAILIPFFLGGCDLPFGEDPPPPAPLNNKLGVETECLAEVIPAMKGFMDGSASAKQVGDVWTCFGSAIELFGESTRGRFEDRYTPRELANFFERYYLKNGTKISPELLRQIFLLKQVFVGGSSEAINRKELEKLSAFAAQMRGLSLRLLPYMKLYSLNWKASGFKELNEDIRYFEAANLEIQNAARELGDTFARNRQSYQIENFVTLLEEVSKLDPSSSWGWLADLKKAMPLIYKLKKTLAGGSENSIDASEWKRFAVLGVRGYIQFLRYYYFLDQNNQVGAGPELIYFARSIDDLFSYLGDMVGDKPGAILTRAEILEILEALALFVPDLKPSDHFLIEAMKIKQVLFGGSLDNFRKEDFEKARSKVETFRNLTERFLSYADVYGQSWDPLEFSASDALEFFKLADQNLSEFGRRLGSIMETPYDLKDAIRLAKELEAFYPPIRKGDKSFEQLAQQYLPVLVSAKNIVLSDQGSLIGRTRGEWSDVLKLSAEGYGRYLFFKYFLTGTSITEGAGLNALALMVSDTTIWLETLIGRKTTRPEKVITFAELEALITAAAKAELLPKSLRVESLNQAMKVLFQKMLVQPERRIQGPLPLGFGAEALRVIRTEFSIWFDMQRFIEVLFQGVPEEGRRPITDVQRDFDRAAATVGVTEMRASLATPVPFVFDDRDQLRISTRPIDFDRESLRTINIARALSRLVIRSFAADLARVSTYQGISNSEANQLFMEVKPLVVDLGLIEKDNTTFADSRFREGNLFTPRANGNDYLDFREAVDLVLLILSGLRTDSYVYKNLEKTCAVEPTNLNDKNDKSKSVRVDCVLPFYAREVRNSFTHLPQFLDFVTELPMDRSQAMFMNLLKAAGGIEDKQRRMKVSDIALVPHVSQYIESVMQRFDTNKDGVLVTSEAMGAYPTFGNILKQVSGLKSENLNRAVFAWFLRYGSQPEGADRIKFLLWWVPRGEKRWNVRADRERIGQIMGFIADSINKELQKKAEALSSGNGTASQDQIEKWEREEEEATRRGPNPGRR
ncbi:MAG: hypothetical protein LW875_07065 [Proteobacteria bacterium]|jgi:hypothetical protein|nr:hypothetical protein [Pseudomonadota bacterium]